MISAVTVILTFSASSAGFVHPLRLKRMSSSDSRTAGFFSQNYLFRLNVRADESSDRNLRGTKKEVSSSPDQAVWQLAPQPNYSTNWDLGLNCALGDYMSTSGSYLDESTIQSNILDFWGEGRTEGGGVETGFRNCYNANYQYQLVSPGADDAGRKIPNRIPTISHENSDIGLYVAADTFKFVTLMGSPINKRTAQEMTRVVQKENGVIILYGATSQDMVDTFEEEASRIGFVHDKYSSLLVTTIGELETITVSDHPSYTRAYHLARPIQPTTCVSRWISVGNESEKDEDRKYSEIVCKEGEALVGRKHKVDGKTWYKGATIRLSNGVVSAECSTKYDACGWVRVESESGEPNHFSSYVCPEGAVLMGQKRRGDANGDTWYKYGWITLNRRECETYDVSSWIGAEKELGKASGGYSEFTCSDGTVLVGILRGEERATTRYKYAKVRIVDI